MQRLFLRASLSFLTFLWTTTLIENKPEAALVQRWVTACWKCLGKLAPRGQRQSCVCLSAEWMWLPRPLLCVAVVLSLLQFERAPFLFLNVCPSFIQESVKWTWNMSVLEWVACLHVMKSNGWDSSGDSGQKCLLLSRNYNTVKTKSLLILSSLSSDRLVEVTTSTTPH